MSKPFIAGNWKMNLGLEASITLATSVDERAKEHKEKVDVAIFPSFHILSAASDKISHAKLGAQNVYFKDEGAFTGEVSAAQVSELVDYAIVGHSERRYVFGEVDELIARKAAACVRNELTPIICVGETQHEREQGETTQVINDQIATNLTMLTAEDVASSIIAYEPVWAIGTGNTARPEDVARAIDTIHHSVEETFGARAAESVRVLYGGSVKADTAGAFLDINQVDGLLVGGSSLDGDEFGAIINRAADGAE